MENPTTLEDFIQVFKNRITKIESMPNLGYVYIWDNTLCPEETGKKVVGLEHAPIYPEADKPGKEHKYRNGSGELTKQMHVSDAKKFVIESLKRSIEIVENAK